MNLPFGQTLATNLVVTNSYNSTQYLFLGYEFRQIHPPLDYIFLLYPSYMQNFKKIKDQ